MGMALLHRFWRVGAVLLALLPSAAAGADGRAELPGVSLAYTDTGGAGVPVILVHALTGTKASWEAQLQAFYQAGFRAIAFDRRGWGQSMAVPATGDQPGTVAGDIDALATHLGLDRFHLVGIAGGGFAALDYAAWHPERLRSLVVAASTGSIDEPEIKTFSRRIEIPGVAWPSVTLEVGPSYIGGNPDGLARWQAIEEHARQPGAPSQPLRTPNTFAKIEAIETPVLVMAGDADLLAPPGLMRIWAARIRHHEWAQVPEAGHSIAWEQPEIFNAQVIDFLRRH
ncbi:alpha/beta hydrolase [Inquilinus sp.]|uniref:alpha/beta fold hydrolase n=1 Tax=Inquilinus sp. TaxID=1932117 RepID=UPI0031DAEAD1